MTEKGMRLKRIDNINKRMKKKYKNVEIDGKTVFFSEAGNIFRLDSIGAFNAIVIEYADDIESAKKGIFGEDGGLFFMEEMDEKEMFEKMTEEIEG